MSHYHNRVFAVFTIILYSISYYLWIGLTRDETSLRNLGGALFSLSAPILASMFFYMNIRRFTDGARRFWLILLASCVSYFIAELIWRYQLVYRGDEFHFPGWADVFWIVNLLFYATALLYKVYQKKKQFLGLQLFFDSFIILTVLTTVSWIYILQPILSGKDLPVSVLFFSLGYPIGHLGVLLGVSMLYVSYKHIFPPKVIALNLSGMIIYIISDSIYFYKSIYGTYEFYGLLTPVWSISLLIIGLSSFYDDETHQARQEEVLIRNVKFVYYIRNFWPYLSIVLLLILSIIRKDQLQSIIVSGVVILFLIALRQIITLLDNESLLTQLQQVNLSLETTKQKLAESEQRYKSLFENHPDAIVLFDPQGVSKAVNRSGKSFQNFTATDQKNIAFHFSKAIQGKSQSFENTMINEGGSAVDCNITFVPVWIHGNLGGVFGIFQDRTEQKRTEEQLRKSEKLAVVSQLAAGVAHEIRNPLTSIKGFLQLIEEGVFKREYMNILQSELNRIELILNDFLTLAKPNQDTAFKKTDLSRTLVHAVRLMEPHAILRNIQLITRIDHGIPLVECIESQMTQVIINIIKNAIEASEEKGRIWIETKLNQDKNISILIKDEGCGIPEDRIHRLGEPFYSNKEKGTGLGLMISYKILEHHKGTIHFSSVVGKGTEVTLTLPILFGGKRGCDLTAFVSL